MRDRFWVRSLERSRGVWFGVASADLMSQEPSLVSEAHKRREKICFKSGCWQAGGSVRELVQSGEGSL